MKKIIAAALAIMLSLSNMAFTQVYAQQTLEKSVQEKAIEKVTALKIMEGYEENGEIVFKPENQITKLEFVVALFCAISDKRDLVNVDADTPFVDITASHWACGYINEAISLNIIEADSLFFNPDVKLVLKDAIKILLDSMGYKEYASVKGDGLSGYMELCTRLKMSNGISTGFNDALTRGEAAILLSNAIDINIMEINGVVGDDFSYEVSETRTIISQMRNIYKVKGTVIANEFTSINQSGATNYAAVKIDSELYLQGNTDIYKELGMLVEAYYVDDGNE
ncbi:MAG: S-layer homology domain-containing protein, partial [Clostridia bacterium]|nr:S-layer homology domain-containing protein [Clostridia bacterium]